MKTSLLLSLLLLLTAFLAWLKLSGVLALSLVVVFLPLWLPAALLLICALGLLVTSIYLAR